MSPKKLALLEKIGLAGGSEDDVAVRDNGPKTGAQLRKERKGELRKKRLQSEAIEKQKRTKLGLAVTPSRNARPGAKVRFTLGNKVEALTAAQLLEIVKSTAPYLFPETAPKMVLDDEEEVEDEEEEGKEEEEKNVEVGTEGVGSGEEEKGWAEGERREARTTAAGMLCDESRSVTMAADSEQGWLRILREFGPGIPATDKPTEAQRVDFFALCMASHFSTVATYVPSDVDSKIRGHCWEDPSEDVLRAQFEIVKHALRWNVKQVSRRTVTVADVEARPLSGHDGEWLGVLCGAYGAFLKRKNAALAQEARDLIVQELEREAALFRHLRLNPASTTNDLLLLKAAAILTHNVGDVDQGLGYWYDEESASTPVPAVLIENKLSLSRLAHERYDRFGGEFGRAKAVYKELLSAEGHRHYPLREAKCLRKIPELMLPHGPFFEGWGRSVASHPGLGYEDKLLVLRQLLRGCDSTSKAWCVPNQLGYFRALNGFASVANLDKMSKDLGPEANVLKEHNTRLHLGLSERSFAEKLGLRAREILEEFE